MFLKELKIELPPKPSNSTSGRLSGKKKKTLIQKDIGTLMFIVALLVNIPP